ncbi:hypothetical protein FF098_012030 [Parvularcula flava]|uniref:UDP-N-acetylmuramate:L-alanyl-gamma-D-glutamyl-meso-diaminopimelate ligase n=1 Tax=Aquisalinus luteolus TaxID=1566827 RepID=A0ABX0HKU7_9PROT|nr:Mur ligase family protein [Aquisalinus luteolus]NHK28638.1 hypothetical protein [Aquisalinus luteolus]
MSENQPKAHFIGLCGAGMSAVAHLLQRRGYEVSGSDDGFYPPVSDYLTRIGLVLEPGYRASNIPADVELIVIGKNARLVPETNEEVALALDQYRDKVKSFPEVLADLSVESERIVVAGSYGKSTLTSMIAWVLIHAGNDPSWFIGAIPKNFDHSSGLGKGTFVFEGDEYPSANWDDRAKFLHYDPSTVVLTSACHDHVNIYPTLESYHKPFVALLQGLKKRDGRLIACTGEDNARAFYEAYPGERVSYALGRPADWTAEDIALGEISSFTLVHEGEQLGTIETSLLGRHNIENITGAAACLIGGGFVTLEEFRAGIARYNGIERRLDRKTDKSLLPVYEGFGSSYEKARSAITALKEHYKDRRLTILFEPHTFTWRNRAALSQYATVFDGAARIWLYAPPTQGAGTHDQVTLDEIHAEAVKHYDDVRTFDAESYKTILTDADPAGDVVLILSSGSFDGLLKKVIAEAELRYPVL